MATDVQFLLLFTVAAIGGIFASLLGWSDSGEPFNARKFMSSVLRSVIGGLVIVVVDFATINDVNILIYFTAFLGGAGIDALGNRAAGTIRPEPPSP